MKSRDLSIGRLAQEAGVNIETIRYYQRRGLLSVPDRPPGGQRRYATAEVKRIRFIKRAQLLGFTLEEIGELLLLDEPSTCHETRERAARKLAIIEAKLADLAAMRDTLLGLVEQCDSGDGGSCPIIHALTSGQGFS